MKKILCVLLAILLIPTTLAFVGCVKQKEPTQTAYEQLGETEKKVYDIALDFSYDFKNPSSFRILSGTYEEKEDSFSLSIRIQAENGYGASGSSYYQLLGSLSTMKAVVKIDLEKGETTTGEKNLNEYAILLGLLKAKYTNDFDYSAVNNALKEYWEKQGI